MKSEEVDTVFDTLEQKVQEIVQYETLVEQKKIEIIDTVTRLLMVLGIKEPGLNIFELLNKAETHFDENRSRLDPTNVNVYEEEPLFGPIIKETLDPIFGPNRPYNPGRPYGPPRKK